MNNEPIILEGAAAIRFIISSEEWPEEAKKRGLKDPFKNDLKQHLLVEEEIEFLGKKIKSHVLKPNPDAPPKATRQEKIDYRFEEDKYLCKRLAELGYYEVVLEQVKYAWDENKGRLTEYIKTLKACSEENGQCTMLCPYFKNGGCAYEEDLQV